MIVMVDIHIQAEQKGDGWVAQVVVTEEGSESRHTVTVPRAAYQQLTQGRVAVGPLVKASFEFLLENEPKESILSSFDIMTIARYFPVYPKTIQKRLGLD